MKEYKRDIRIKVLFRKNLRMSPGKLAAQAVHAAIALGATDPNVSVVVLGLSDKKFYETVGRLDQCVRIKDAGHTEIPPDTETCAAFFEQKA